MLVAAALAVATACSSAPQPRQPRADVADAEVLARDAAGMLLRISAYDYALAGTLASEHTYIVDRARYASVAASLSTGVDRFTAATLTATVDREGLVRDQLVALADGLVDLSHDATRYADGGDPAVFAKVNADVAHSWEDLRTLTRGVRDRSAADEISKTIARGSSFVVRGDQKVGFTRSGPAPDAELWSEPERVFDTWGSARRVAVSPNALWVATGSDDGTVAIFNGDGVLRSLPRFHAGVSQLVFSDDARWLMGGGQTLANFILPQGTAVGTMVRLDSPAQQVVYVPNTYYFAVIAAGDGSGGTGVLTGRSPDGQPLFVFPVEEPAAGGAIAATAAGELYVAASTNGTTEIVRYTIVNKAWKKDGILKVPGQVQQLTIDRSGILGAAMTDKGVFRFGPHDTDPARTLTRIGDPVKEIAFGPDGRLYMLAKESISARDLRGELLWSAPLIDGRRLVTAARPVVLDGPDQLLAFNEKGIPDVLGTSGNIQDVSASSDGKRVAVLNEGRRALLFKFP